MRFSTHVEMHTAVSELNRFVDLCVQNVQEHTGVKVYAGVHTAVNVAEFFVHSKFTY